MINGQPETIKGFLTGKNYHPDWVNKMGSYLLRDIVYEF
ncbi:hypothetical protein D1BOALGB6SA_4038 [Olavius sp. associated proteobacterium Delta 1]|nr:hypothetical protein D1BOALGB6SA_4038 [Olavius sp. associated proteobacterium Delta 1]